MLNVILDGVVFTIQASSVAGLIYGGLLCLRADSMFQVARQARANARARAGSTQAYIAAAHA
jgi:hypothetical protein